MRSDLAVELSCCVNVILEQEEVKDVDLSNQHASLSKSKHKF